MFRFFSAIALLLCLALSVVAEDAKEAVAEAGKHLRTRDYKAAQAPLERALKLTPDTDTRQRIQIYRMLMASYRLLPEEDKMAEAVEYIQDHSDSVSERSNVASDFASFLHQRGKTEWAVARYEERLARNAQDPVALGILSVVYRRGPGDKKERGKTLEANLKKLDLERAIAKAERLAKSADESPTAAASNWKDVAKAWLEADNQDQARQAVERSLKSAPESRSALLTMYWHEGLGDVLLALGETDRAIKEFEAAQAAAPAAALKTPIEKKLAKVKGKQK